MKTYFVRRREVWVSYVEIDAESPQAALQLVSGGAGDELEDLLEYSHTLDSDSWDVEDPETGELVS